jgi:hypothetical protein
MKSKFNWDKVKKETRLNKSNFQKKRDDRYKQMAESKYYCGPAYKHKCSLCGKEFTSKYPTCYQCHLDKKDKKKSLSGKVKYKPANY